VDIDESVLRVVFDTAVHSMDFGSGFLDDEEVEALRAAAIVLGVDPDEATPQNFKCKYRGHHRAHVYLDSHMFTGPDGIWRNAYKGYKDFPEDARGKLKRSGTLGMLRAPVLGMFCPDCGGRWPAIRECSS